MGEDREKHKSKDKHRDRDRGVEKASRDDKTLRDDKNRSRRDRDKVRTQNLPRGFPCSERWGSITIPQEYANPLLDCPLFVMHRAACVCHYAVTYWTCVLGKRERQVAQEVPMFSVALLLF